MDDDFAPEPDGPDGPDGWDDAWDDVDDAAFADDEHAEPTPIRRFEQSAAGAVLAAGMLGLRNVFEGPAKEEIQVVADWNGDKPFSDPYVLRLDPDHPEDSIVMVRPWLVKHDDDPDADVEKERQSLVDDADSPS